MNQNEIPKILFVDDDSFLTKLLEKKFISAGYDFMSLSNAEGDFAGIVSEIRPALILMDINLKKNRTGVDAVKILQADERTKSIPFIFLTNGDLPESANLAKQMSAVGFIIKAILMPNEVVSKVQELYEGFIKK